MLFTNSLNETYAFLAFGDFLAAGFLAFGDFLVFLAGETLETAAWMIDSSFGLRGAEGAAAAFFGEA